MNNIPIAVKYESRFVVSKLCPILIAQFIGSSALAQDAHVHGLAQLNLVREGQQVQLEFSSPAMNFLGFERAPESEEERELLANISDALAGSGWLLGDSLADCDMTVEALELPEFGNEEHEHDHDEDHDHEEEHDHDEDHSSHDHDEQADGHSDFRVQYLFNCRNSVPAEIQITAFQHFPGIEQITTQWIVERSPGLSELTPDDSVLAIE